MISKSESVELSPLSFERLAVLAVSPTAQVELCRVVDGNLHGTFAAVKRLPHEMSEDPELRDMFRDEIWMATMLRHPNVARVLGWGDDDAGPFLASEFVRGVSLARLMRTVFSTGEAFTERLIVFMAAKLCGGLAHAHALRSEEGEHLALVHRDLTPGNILLGFDGTVKITDFGLAKAKMRITQTAVGMTKGDPAYMSPEQVVGGDLDGRSDIFALGIVLFELFAQHKPWTVQNVEEALNMIVEGNTPDLRKTCPRVDKKLVAVIEQCLNKKPDQRYESAHALKERLDEWLMLHGYQDSQDTLARFVRRNAMRQMRWVDRAMAGHLATQDPAKAEPSPLELSRDEPVGPLRDSFAPPPIQRSSASQHEGAAPKLGDSVETSEPFELKEPALVVKAPRPSVTGSDAPTMRTFAKKSEPPPTQHLDAAATSSQPAVTQRKHSPTALTKSERSDRTDRTPSQIISRKRDAAPPLGATEDSRLVLPPQIPTAEDNQPTGRHPSKAAPEAHARSGHPSGVHGHISGVQAGQFGGTAAPMPRPSAGQAQEVHSSAIAHPPATQHLDDAFEPDDPTDPRVFDEPSTLRKAPVLGELQDVAKRIALGASALSDKALGAAHQARLAAQHAQNAGRTAQAAAMRAEQAAEAARLAADAVQLAQDGDLHKAIEVGHRALQLHRGAVEEG